MSMGVNRAECAQQFRTTSEGLPCTTVLHCDKAQQSNAHTPWLGHTCYFLYYLLNTFPSDFVKYLILNISPHIDENWMLNTQIYKIIFVTCFSHITTFIALFFRKCILTFHVFQVHFTLKHFNMCALSTVDYPFKNWFIFLPIIELYKFFTYSVVHQSHVLKILFLSELTHWH